MPLASECLFCRIVAHDEPAEVVHATDRIMAFRDRYPRAPTHILLIPKDHIESVSELTEKHGAVLAELFTAAAHLAKAEGIDRSGYRLVVNTGPEAGQSVFHLHLHLLGGRPMSWPPG